MPLIKKELMEAQSSLIYVTNKKQRINNDPNIMNP